MSSASAGTSQSGHAKAPQMGWPRTLGRLVEGRNINPETLLATDYLNHFNEIAMLIEMTGDMPECLEDIADWEPMGYAAHFRNSTFADKELAILAYENAPAKHRDPFDTIIEQANRIAGEAVYALSQAIVRADEEAAEPVNAVASRYSATLRRLIDMASGVIHGHGPTMDQTEIDAILAE